MLIQVESTLKGTQCHRCGRKIDRFHGYDRPIRLRHLPILDQVSGVDRVAANKDWNISCLLQFAQNSYGPFIKRTRQ